MKKFWRTSVRQEVDDELEFHLEMTTRELMARGVTRQQARAEAERRFGDAAVVHAQCRRFGNERARRERRAEYLTELRQDVAFAVRQLIKTTGFTAVAIVTLALGIGATAAMFSALNAVLLRPLPFPDPDRVVALHPTFDGVDNSMTPPEYFAFRNVRELEHVAAARLGGGVTLQVGDVPEMVDAAGVSADYFAVFGVRPALGRTFTREEDEQGGPAAIILSHRFWATRFNADPAVLDRVLQIDGTPRTVVGIMPASFDYVKGSANIWTPLAFGPDDATKFGAHYLRGFARLRPNVTVAQARSATTAAAINLARQIPNRSRPLEAYGMDVRRFSDDLVRDYRALLFILLGAVGFVLLIACGNVANLLLARGTVRARELAIRAALGAGRGRLFRQLLTESLVLAFAGAIAGLAVAFALLRMLRVVSTANVPRIDQATVDWRVLGFTLLLGIACSIIFGLVPALRAARPGLQQTLREGGRGSGAAPDQLRPFLVGAQVALTLALLVGAGLLIRSAWLVQHVDPGFEPRGVLTSRILLPANRYPTGESITRTFARFRQEVARIPGVAGVALSSVVPLSGSQTVASITSPDDRTTRRMDADLRFASDGYFELMHIPLVAGRDIAPTDLAESTPVAVVTVSFVAMVWPSLHPREAIGKLVGAIPTRRSDVKNWQVVGVVGDVHDASLTLTPKPGIYAPYTQTAEAFWPFLGRSLVVVVRTASIETDPETLVRPLQNAINRIDPSLPLADKESMESYLRDTLATARMNTLLLSTLGAIALVLAMVGVYGVVAYFVGQRTAEIGIRVALGATPAGIGGFVLRRGMLPVVAGLAMGVGLSFVTSTLLRAQLFGVTARDPLTIAIVAALLLVVALVAMYVPTRRAMQVSPIEALQAS